MNGHLLDDLRTVRMQLQNEDPEAHRHNLIEIDFAIAEVTAGEPNTHTATVERWVNLLIGTAA